MSATPAALPAGQRPKDAETTARPMEPCRKCGLEHERCAGHRGDGAPCGKRPIRGGTVCATHGGSAPQVKAAAARRLEERALEGSIGQLIELHRPDLVDVDPHQALLEVVADTYAWRKALWLLVGDLVAKGGHSFAMVGEGTADGRLALEYVPADPAGLWGPDHQGNAKPHVLVGMLHAATDEHLKACKYAIDAGIEERRVRLAEGTAEAIAGVLRAMAAGVLELLGRLGGAKELVASIEEQMPDLMWSALELARTGVIDVNETKGAGPWTR